MEDTTRPALVTTRIDRVELTNEDRYYRPGTGSSTSLSLEARAGRLEISSGLSASQARKERSPVSPRRKRARSNSPIAIRVAEPSLERESVSSRSGRRKARADAAASRLANNYIPERDQLVRRRSVSPRNFSQPNDNDRLFRRGHDEDLMQVDHFDQRPGRLLGKQEDDNREYRGRSRDRDYPQAYDRRPDSREPPYRTYQSSQRSRSPPPRTDTRYADRGREPEPREQEQERWDRDAQQNRRHADPAPPSRYREISPRPVPELSSRSGRDREVHSSRYERRDLSPPHLANETAFTKQEAAVQPRQQNRDRPSGMDSYRPRYEEDIHQTAVRDQSPPRSYGRDVDRGRQDAPSKDNRYRPEPLQIPIPEASREEIPSPPQQLAPAPPRRGAPLPPQHASFRQRAISQQSASSTRNLPAKELSPQGANKHLSPSSPVQSFGSRALPTLGSSSETRIADRHGHSLNDRHYSPERPHGQEIENGRQTAGLGSSRAANAPRIEEPSRSGPDRRALPPTGPATERREGHPRPLPERTSSKRRRGGKLTGTNDIRIANRRTGFNLAVATPQLAPQHLGSGNQSTPPVFNTRVPTGPREQAPSKSSYERPLDQPSVDHAPRGGRPNRAERNRSRVEPESKLQDDRGRVRDRPLHPMTAPSLSVNGLSSRDATAPPLSREDSVFSSTLDESSARQSADEKELQPPRSSLNGYDSALGSINRTSPQQLRPMPTTPPEPERQSTLEYPLSPSLQRRLSMSGDPLPPRLRKAIPSPEPKKTRPEDLSAPPEDRSSFLERVERPASLRRSESLLDRMNSDDPSRRGMDNSATSPSQSLRERMVPTKRDHDEMRAESRYTGADRPYDADDGHEMKRSRKRSGKPRRIPHTVGGGGGGRRYGP
ncbi:hypothetical protein CPB83DRAFT_856162 [Crepidotus variabilis]|uniref:Uncharacterized protein n=1 Tax=Crepidotus variabilis TaxID=179855 RepID=A0A9P6JNI6_9AGAR|nr:hypothetical protein CPB83DRAFT_856162 [Crepidotus variabilis]